MYLYVNKAKTGEVIVAMPAIS